MTYLIVIVSIPALLLVLLFALKALSLKGKIEWYRRFVRRGDVMVVRLYRKALVYLQRVRLHLLSVERGVVESQKEIFYSVKRRIAKWAEKVAHKLSD